MFPLRCGTDDTGFATHPLREPTAQQQSTATRLLLAPTAPDKPSIFAIRPPEMLTFTLELYTILTLRDSHRPAAITTPADFVDWMSNGFRDLEKARVRLHPDIILPQHSSLLQNIFTAAGTTTSLLSLPTTASLT